VVAKTITCTVLKALTHKEARLSGLEHNTGMADLQMWSPIPVLTGLDVA